MFEKILVAEDFDSANIAVKDAAKELNIPMVTQVYYCDDALFKIQQASKEKQPYQLLITDLSFVENYDHNINSGKDLIQAVKKDFPDIKIIVFSIENRNSKIQSLIDNFPIDAYIIKGRGDIKDLKNAIIEVYNGNKYFPILEDNIISDYDIELVKLLRDNYQITEVANSMKKNKITPNGKTYIYDRISFLKKAMKVNSIGELILKFSKLGYL